MACFLMLPCIVVASLFIYYHPTYTSFSLSECRVPLSVVAPTGHLFQVLTALLLMLLQSHPSSVIRVAAARVS